MRVGFASVFAFRPHVEHLYYLSRLVQEAGHDVRMLTCDAQLPYCYARALKHSAAAVECPKCIAGGLRSYSARVASLPAARGSVGDLARAWADSSACTVLRIEAAQDRLTAEFIALRERLAGGAQRAFDSARRWIEAQRLGALICFNGRMEATRGICEAACAAGVPFLTVERTWFGDGLQFAVNDNVLDLSQLDRLNAEYRDVPLTQGQARRIAQLLAARLLRRNDKEWRAYNRNAAAAVWPATAGGGPRVLIAPSSRNEVEGHPHWTHGWPQLTDGIDAVLDAVGATSGNTVLRCHPNWGERIGRRSGKLSERYYSAWARHRGVHLIGSAEPASTFELIQQADLVVVTGGSAAFEASCLGKPVISLTPSTYRTAAIAAHVTSAAELPLARTTLLADPLRVRRGLRYGYTHTYRFSQYVDFVRAVTTTRYRYFDGADPHRLESMLRTARVEADDPTVAPDATGEDEVLALVESRQWQQLIDRSPPMRERGAIRISRRPGLRWIDGLRERFPTGDR
jgi:hypothetical protein